MTNSRNVPILIFFLAHWTMALWGTHPVADASESTQAKHRFFEEKIRPLLVEHCYPCHSEAAQEQQGGLLLDRRSGWLDGGDSGKAVVPGNPDASLLIQAARYEDEGLQMPPERKLSHDLIALLERWIEDGAVGPKEDLGETEFSRLGDQDYLFKRAADHWAFQPIAAPKIPVVGNRQRNGSDIDRLVFSRLAQKGLRPSQDADARTLCRRLYFDLTGLPPTIEQVSAFTEAMKLDPQQAVGRLADRLLAEPAFGQHFGRLWLDVVRYADTDSAYRPDTKTPHYFPFAFTYRDYVIDSLNVDKPYDQFLLEQFAADELGFVEGDSELAALGFFTVGPHANRAQAETFDDWIDLTTRGLMGLTVACARCHDHKYEPVPTVDYYSLRGIFAEFKRPSALDERLPVVAGYQPSASDIRDYERLREEIEKKIAGVGKQKARGNNQSLARQIRETELAELLLFHPGAPSHAMVLRRENRVPPSVVFIRGDATNRGESAPKRFVRVLDPQQVGYDESVNSRLQLARQIVAEDNPMTPRVFVNRVWGALMGSHLVDTPSDFGLQGARPSHPELLDHLAYRFVERGWSIKQLVRSIVTSKTYRQGSEHRPDQAGIDPENRFYWRANRKRLTIESLRDSVLAVSGQLDSQVGGRAAKLWSDDYTRRRAVYGYINRFNLDPTLRAFDFPSPMQTHPKRGESVVASQALFTLNASYVVDQARAIASAPDFIAQSTDGEKISSLFLTLLQRPPAAIETERVQRFLVLQRRMKPVKRFDDSPWPMVAQAIIMSNEFQYID